MQNRNSVLFACGLVPVCLLLTLQPAAGQTTQGIISGRVTDVYTGNAAAGAQISFDNQENGVSGRAQADASGHYTLPLLSPGTYRVRATAGQYQAQEVHQLIVPVAGRLDVSFWLR